MYPVEECKIFCPSSVPPPGWQGTWTHSEPYNATLPFTSSTPAPPLNPNPDPVKESGQGR
jgi:hypothetical protein